MRSGLRKGVLGTAGHNIVLSGKDSEDSVSVSVSMNTLTRRCTNSDASARDP